MAELEEQTHLIVDGYNVAHAWGLAKAGFGQKIDSVVNSLQEELKDIHDEKGWRVTIVLEAVK